MIYANCKLFYGSDHDKEKTAGAPNVKHNPRHRNNTNKNDNSKENSKDNSYDYNSSDYSYNYSDNCNFNWNSADNKSNYNCIVLSINITLKTPAKHELDPAPDSKQVRLKFSYFFLIFILYIQFIFSCNVCLQQTIFFSKGNTSKERNKKIRK